MRKIFILVTIFATVNGYAQFPRVEIPGSELRTLTSSVVAGQEYELQVMLPGNYNTQAKKYPVVYLMDAQWDFPLLKSLYGQQYYDGFIPELIIVGVTWGGIKPNPDSLRARDYTPTKDGRLPQSGGADQFLSFMKNELFPFIETNYRADNKNRILMGCSLGGLITLYTLFTQPGLFTGYVAASPAIGWDQGVLFKLEKDFSKKELPAPVRVYLTVGDVERGRPEFERFAAQMAARSYVSVSFLPKVLENTGHSGTKSETFGRGLQYLFERPRLKLDITLLAKYSGHYETVTGNKVEIRKEADGLFLYFSPGNKYQLYAAAENDFYSTSEFLHMHFKTEGRAITGFQLERYGKTEFIKRTD